MKKRSMILAALLAAAALFAVSCASAGPAAPTPPPAAAPEQVAPPPAIPEPEPAPEPAPAVSTPTPAAAVVATPAGDLILEGAKSYTVVDGDTLTKIAIRFYGWENAYYFPVIHLASRDEVLHPDFIVEGMELTLPDLDTNKKNPASRARMKAFIAETAVIYDQKGDPDTAEELRGLAGSL
jgi:nucleoid-associated protein YgaU